MLLRRTGKFIEAVTIPASKITKEGGTPGRHYDTGSF